MSRGSGCCWNRDCTSRSQDADAGRYGSRDKRGLEKVNYSIASRGQQVRLQCGARRRARDEKGAGESCKRAGGMEGSLGMEVEWLPAGATDCSQAGGSVGGGELRAPRALGGVGWRPAGVHLPNWRAHLATKLRNFPDPHLPGVPSPAETGAPSFAKPSLRTLGFGWDDMHGTGGYQRYRSP